VLRRQSSRAKTIPRKTIPGDDKPGHPLGARRRRRCVLRPPWQAAVGTVAPERLEEDPVLEERLVAAGTGKGRHAFSRPGNRGHPDDCHYEKRRVLEQQVVKQPGQQERSGEATEEQRPENCRPAMQIAPCRVERKSRGHRVFRCTSGLAARRESNRNWSALPDSTMNRHYHLPYGFLCAPPHRGDARFRDVYGLVVLRARVRTLWRATRVAAKG
jgi:hypothetical protein